MAITLRHWLTGFLMLGCTISSHAIPVSVQCVAGFCGNTAVGVPGESDTMPAWEFDFSGNLAIGVMSGLTTFHLLVDFGFGPELDGTTPTAAVASAQAFLDNPPTVNIFTTAGTFSLATILPFGPFVGPNTSANFIFVYDVIDGPVEIVGFNLKGVSAGIDPSMIQFAFASNDGDLFLVPASSSVTAPDSLGLMMVGLLLLGLGVRGNRRRDI